MSDYTKTVDFAAKDALASGNAAKVAKGSEIDNEFDNIAVAIATKYDSTDRGAANGIAPLDGSALVPVANLPTSTTSARGAVELATTTEAAAGTDTARAVTPAGLEAWAAQNDGMVQDISNLNLSADALLGWDQSASAAIGFTLGSGLDFSGTTIVVDDSDIDHDDLDNFVANEHINHSSVSITAGNGLSGGGNITETRAITLGTGGSVTATSTNAVTTSSHTHAVGAGIARFSSASGGAITVSTSNPSGTPATNDIWIKREA